MNTNFYIMKKKIIEILNKYSEIKCDGKLVNLSDIEFNEVAEELNDLFALRIVNRSLEEKYTQTFEEFMTNFCRYGITLTNNNTRETIGLKDLIQKWKLTNEVKP